MSITRKLVGVGADEPTYVDDVFSTYLYEGGTGTVHGAPASGSLTHVLQFLDNGNYLLTCDQSGDKLYIHLLEKPYASDRIASTTTGNYGGQIVGSQGVAVSPDGTKLFLTGRVTTPVDERIAYQYTLSTPYDASTMTYDGVSATLSLSSGSGTPILRGLSFNPTGTAFWASHPDGYLYEYALTTPWSLAEVTYTRELDITTSETNVYMASFSPDGLNLIIVGSGAGLSQWTLTTAWDITTATYTGFSIKPSSSDYITSSLAFAAAFTGEGKGVAILDNDKVISTTSLGTEYDISTISARRIVNGIDLDDKGGLVWFKNREDTRNHCLFDTETDPTGQYYLISNSTDAKQNTGASQLTYNSDGFTITNGNSWNANGKKMASWTFAKQEGFFDVVTWTGNDVNGREIPHNLGSEPGMIIVKCISGATNWIVYHKSLGATKYLILSHSSAEINDGQHWNSTEPTDSVFTVGYELETNYGGALGGGSRDYVAYLFADDAPMFGPDGDESIIKCGSYVGTGTDSTAPEIDLGWEPQYVLVKNASWPGTWAVFDSMRGWTTSSSATDAKLYPNESNAESLDRLMGITSTGFFPEGGDGVTNGNGNTHIYMAIRRPMKPAEEFEPDELFATTKGDGVNTPGYNHGFVTDMAWRISPASGSQTNLSSRLNQGQELETNSNLAEKVNFGAMFDYMEGWWNRSRGTTIHSWGFRRAPGFFDVVTYEGDGVKGHKVPHNLSAEPEMVWLKATDLYGGWLVRVSSSATGNLSLERDRPLDSSNGPAYTMDDTNLTLSNKTTEYETNNPGSSYIAHLFASVPGICDIGSYTGTGADMNIDCGFTNGARFILIKRTDDTGDWMYWDTLRGIVGPNGLNYLGNNGQDPYLTLNSADAEVTNNNWLTPLPLGFTINDVSLDNPGTGLINLIGAEYIYMAIA